MEGGVEKAIGMYYAAGHKEHKHQRSCVRLVGHILSPDENTVMEVKQSYLYSLAPDRILITNRRLIIVRPSFWGLYLGFDLISPTNISIVPYKNIISVVLSRGKHLSTLNMRIRGFLDATEGGDQGEGAIPGIKTRFATVLANFLEEVIEYRGNEQKAAFERNIDSLDGNSLSLEEAKKLVNKSNKKFIWLGIEPLDSVMKILDAEKSSVVKINAGDISDIDEKKLREYEGYVFVCYDGETSRHIVGYLRDKYDISTYNLRGGINETAKVHFNKFM